MTDRLRRLDQLFAEKVLGKTVPLDYAAWREREKIHPMESALEAYTMYEIALGRVQPYTRSLDAAWEGAKRLMHGRPFTSYFGVTQWEPGETRDSYCEASIEGGPTPKCPQCSNSASRHITVEASHPAEALVLACLRAVGCTEEELK